MAYENCTILPAFFMWLEIELTVFPEMAVNFECVITEFVLACKILKPVMVGCNLGLINWQL